MRQSWKFRITSRQLQCLQRDSCCRPLLQKGCIHAKHANRSAPERSVILAATAQSESPTTQTNSATSPDESAVPVVSENAAAEVPDAEVASQDHLAAAQEKSQAGPTDVPTDITASIGQPSQSGQSSQGARTPPGRARQQRKPRTVEVSQLVPGAEFEGTIVSKPCLAFNKLHCQHRLAFAEFAIAPPVRCS